MTITGQAPTSPADAPAPVRRYLAADARHDGSALAVVFAPAATLIDDGHAYFGRDAIKDWRDGPAMEWTYTQKITDARPTGPNSYLLIMHLEGNFPGGAADLHYRFAVLDDQIVHLTIEA